MKIPKFKLGDRVKYSDIVAYKVSFGDLGTILAINNDYGDCGVEWDMLRTGHDLFPLNTNHTFLRPCKDGKGWYVPKRYLTLVVEERFISKPCTCNGMEYCNLCGGSGIINKVCGYEDNKEIEKDWCVGGGRNGQI